VPANLNFELLKEEVGVETAVTAKYRFARRHRCESLFPPDVESGRKPCSIVPQRPTKNRFQNEKSGRFNVRQQMRQQAMERNAS